MKLLRTDQGIVLDVYVKPESRAFKIKAGNDELLVFCHDSPTKGKVNRELVKELSRLFKERVEIVSGLSSRQKKILITNISIEQLNEVLSARTQ